MENLVKMITNKVIEEFQNPKEGKINDSEYITESICEEYCLPFDDTNRIIRAILEFKGFLISVNYDRESFYYFDSTDKRGFYEVKNGEYPKYSLKSLPLEAFCKEYNYKKDGFKFIEKGELRPTLDFVYTI